MDCILRSSHFPGEIKQKMGINAYITILNFLQVSSFQQILSSSQPNRDQRFKLKQSHSITYYQFKMLLKIHLM